MSAENVSRRQILKTAAVAGAAGALGPFFPGRVLGANDRIQLAVVGVRSRGTAHIAAFAKMKAQNVEVKYLCDVDGNVLEQRLAGFEKDHGYRPQGAADLRKILDDKSVDAVSIATPNHWHALGAIWAAQAKKHVYVEKPACHNVWEGRQMVGAARKNNILMQVGFQNRSFANTTAAIKFIRDGKLGKVFMARGLCFKPRTNIGRYPDGPQKEGDATPPMVGKMPSYTAAYLEKVNYDLWMGPAPAKPFNPNRFHYNWHWQWDYGAGDTGNQGPHQFDVARWGLGKDEYPARVRSFGGLYLWGDSQQETPNVQTSLLEYADGTLLEFATRGTLTNGEGAGMKSGENPGVRIGVIFYGSEGRLEIDDGGNWRTFMGSKGEPGPDSKSIKMDEVQNALDTVGQGSGHFGNFIAALRSGKREDLHCDVEVGFKSTVLPLVSNISYRLKRELKMDPHKEAFIGDAEANKMLKREFRKPYAVPSLVG